MIFSTLYPRATQRDFAQSLVYFIRTICAVLLVLFLLPGAGAFAGDYTVSYAFDAGDVNDTGKTECEFKYICEVNSEKFDLNLAFSFSNSERNYLIRHAVRIWIHGTRASICCYFSDGVDSIVRSAESLIRLNVYKGHRRIRNEFIQNEPFGVLYLQFSNTK